MSVKLTDIQLQLLIRAIDNRIIEINSIINPLLSELAEHKNFLQKYSKDITNASTKNTGDQSFEVLPWSKKIVQILQDSGKLMTANEIVTEVVSRVPELAGEPSTRSSVASILSRRTGKLFTKEGDKYGLVDWK